MIGAVREWLTAVIAVTMLIFVVQILVPEGTARQITSFAGSLILILTLLRPLQQVNIGKWEFDLTSYEDEVVRRQEELTQTQKEELSGYIEERTAAYILDKAESIALPVSVCVETKANAQGIPVPYAVKISGAYSEELKQWMERELGLPAERQVWHGSEN